MGTRFEKTFSPFRIGKLILKNRLTVAPMGDGYLGMCGPRGEYSDRGIEHTVMRARGGFGLMIQGCVLMPDNKVDDFDPISSVLDNQDIFIKQGLLMNERASYYGMHLFQQLTLGLGRNWGHYSCSPIPWFDDPTLLTRELTKDQIRQKVACVVEAAELMKKAGFSGVEVHALHWGYLLDQFAMSITNHREDEYGGSLENRMRVCKEIVTGIKQVCGDDYPVSMRLGLKSYIKALNVPSLTGENEAGRTLEEGIRIAVLLEQYGYDALNVDVGMYDSFYHACPPSYMPEGHVIPLAAETKKAVRIPVICGSRMNDPYMNEEAIAAGKIDAVAIGRASLADPDYAKKLEAGIPQKIRPCIGCVVGCMGRSREGATMTCAVNPLAYRESEPPRPAAIPKAVLVAGGGLAGMEAARTARLRGLEVAIHEKTDRLGGWAASGLPGFKRETGGLADWYIREIEDLKIPVIFNSELDAGRIAALRHDMAIVAIGGKPKMPDLPGIDRATCMPAARAMGGEGKVGENVVVYGNGLEACEAAIDHAMRGSRVSLISEQPVLLSEDGMISIMVEQMIHDLLAHHEVNVFAGHRIEEIHGNAVTISSVATDEKQNVDADCVLVSLGAESMPGMEKELLGSGVEVFTVGDAARVGNVYTTIHGAHEVARNL